MEKNPRLYKIEQRSDRLLTFSDGVVLIGITALIYLGVRLAFASPAVITGPEISLDPRTLPWYAARSLSRMTAAYLLSLIFTIFYGRGAAYHKRAEQILIPLLDVLQSVPILSFLPVVLLGLNAFLPENFAAELASIVLIFTSQAWNLTFAWYQSLTTIPKELREASAIFRLNTWIQFKTLEIPFAVISLVWNSVMSWAGGWFFLMAAETFTVGNKDFRLPGLGSYLHAAAERGDITAIAWGLGGLILVIVGMDQLVWRPLLAWSDRFKVEMVESDQPPTSWFYDLLSKARLVKWFGEAVSQPFMEKIDRWSIKRSSSSPIETEPSQRSSFFAPIILGLFSLAFLYGFYRAGQMLATLPLAEWKNIAFGVLSTLLRVLAALAIALGWTIPLGVAIGTNRRVAGIFQPLVQIAAAVPATALFPIVLLLLLRLPAGLNLAVVALMLMGTQWYLLFNIIAGANAIPQDLKYTSTLIHLNGWNRWIKLILPALFPYIITGAITASGGAWNASIVAEYVIFGGQTFQVTGIGSTIARATATGDYRLLLAATLSMVVAVILINRLVWRRLYRLAEEKYRME